MRQIVVLVLGLLVSFVPFNLSAAQSTCPDALPSRIIAEDFARVLAGNTLNLRDTPSTAGVRLAQIPEDHAFYITGRSQCADGLTWFEVEYEPPSEDVLTGWVVEALDGEYLIEPLLITFPNTVGYPDLKIALPEGYDVSEGTPVVHEPESLNSGFVFAITERVGIYTRLPRGAQAIEMEIYPADVYDAQITRQGESLQPIRDMIAAYRSGEAISRDDLQAIVIPEDRFGFMARPRFVPFNGGVFIRYVYYMSLNGSPNPLRDTSLYYDFFGMTDDGAYFIEGIMQVDTRGLFDEDYKEYSRAELQNTYQGYLNQSSVRVEEADPSVFIPELAVLDSTLASMEITGGNDEAAFTAQPLTEFVEAPEGGFTQESKYVCGLEPRLTVNAAARQILTQDSIRVRETAGGLTTGASVFPNQVVRVLEGPVCAEGRSWWRVEAEDGSWSGWVSEGSDTDYFFAPETE